tara:strand:- start:3409 stop:4143 length:735 start_codon:yes stop_codon:yes gene_type:complete
MLKVSLITISYNSSKTIYNTLKSVEKQSYKNVEHIIVDGRSTDNTLKICYSFPHIDKIISEPDEGVYDAFNKGIESAKGDIIGFLNSDDVYYEEDSLNYIVKNFDSETDCVFGNLQYVNLKGEIVRNWNSRNFRKGDFKKAWMPAHPTFYCRKYIYEKYGAYNPKYKIAGDFELMLRVLEKNSIKSKFIDRILVKMLSGGISNRGINSKMQILKEEFEAFKENSIKVNKLSYIINKMIKIRQFF